MKKKLLILLIISSLGTQASIYADWFNPAWNMVCNTYTLGALTTASIGYWYWKQQQGASSQNQSYNECPVCFEEQPLQTFACNHGMCKTCAYSWFITENKKNCPTCRQPIDRSEHIAAYIPMCAERIMSNCFVGLCTTTCKIGGCLLMMKLLDPTFKHTQQLITSHKKKTLLCLSAALYSEVVNIPVSFRHYLATHSYINAAIQ